jgi:nucleoside-diphosphate-sugar epimerase
MKISITGATGYIGFNVALAFRRPGHQVFGLTRAAEKAPRLFYARRKTD